MTLTLRLATFLCVSLVGWSATDALALTSAEISCRDAIARTEAKYAKTVLSVIQKCHRSRSGGDRSLSDDCNVVSEADDRGKATKTRFQSKSKIVAACTGASALLAQYPACPAPASAVDNGGATTGIDSYEELADCLLALVDFGAGAASADGQGLPDDRVLDAIVDCQRSVGRGMTGLIRAYMSERRNCQRESDRNGGSADYACESYDDNGKIARAQGSLSEKIFEACDFIPPEELAKLNACSDTSGGLAACAKASADEQGATLIRNAYELPDPVATTTTTSTTSTTTTIPSDACGDSFPACGGDCASGLFCENTGTQCECVEGTGACAPATILRHLNARYGTPAGQTQLSTGWTGKTHVVDVPDDSFDAIDVTCDSNCENCDVSLNVREGDPTTNCRCDSDPRIPCSAINGNDTDSCGGINPLCNCYFGPALGISSGGTPVCVLNVIREDYSGTMDLRTGNYSDVIKLASLVHLGVSQFAPCPTCNNDTTPYDGVRNGTCNGGLQNGQSCDVNGVHRSFGAVSFDCPPTSASNISGGGLQITLELKSGPQSLTAALPCDAPAGEMCPCRVCSGNSQLGCTSNSDCAEADAGNCTAGGNVPIEPNQCDDAICSPPGVCNAGPVDQFCDGAVHADGRGYVSCNTNADCVALNAGACTVLDLRRCFLDPISVTGTADVYNPVNSAIFCIPPTTNDPVNLTAGLPGPGTTSLDFAVDVRCQSDPTIVYEFPDGANCPDLGTTTSTTSTTLPIPNCGEAEFPVCAGTCPGTQVCTPTVNSCLCTGP
jgi:hypothetical protein